VRRTRSNPEVLIAHYRNTGHLDVHAFGHENDDIAHQSQGDDVFWPLEQRSGLVQDHVPHHGHCPYRRGCLPAAPAT